MKKLVFLIGLFITTFYSYAQMQNEDIPRLSDKYSQEQNIFIKELQIAYNEWQIEQQLAWQMPLPRSFGGAQSWEEADAKARYEREYQAQRERAGLKYQRYLLLKKEYDEKYVNVKKPKEEPTKPIAKRKKK